MGTPRLICRTHRLIALTLLAAVTLLVGCDGDGKAAADDAGAKKSTGEVQKPTSQPKTGGTKKGDTEKGDTKEPVKAVAFKVPGDAVAGKKVAKKKCKTCHKIDGKGLAVGPAMDKMYRRFLDARMDEYPRLIGGLKKKHKDIYEARKKDIDEIVATTNKDERLYRWLKHYIRQPTFDRPACKMKPVVLTDKQLENVIAFLFSLPK